MLFAYRIEDGKLARMAAGDPIADAIWIDLHAPEPDEVALVNGLGLDVPSLADMEEIEISNRLYREGGADYMTVMLPGQSPDKAQMSGPVTFILTRTRLVTVRHHAPRPFETFADRADRSGTGCASADHLFLGLVEEIVARLADLLEGVGRSLDGVARSIYGGETAVSPAVLQRALDVVGREGEVLSRVRLGLLTMERMLSYFAQGQDARAADRGPRDGQGAAGQGATGHQAAGRLKAFVKSHMRDIQALEVHADFLSARVGMVTDATLGMVNLAQNATVRILSVISALFLPPTLIASVYGMNFAHMPELDEVWGYPMSIGLMVGSAVVTYLILRWKRWL